MPLQTSPASNPTEDFQGRARSHYMCCYRFVLLFANLPRRVIHTSGNRSVVLSGELAKVMNSQYCGGCSTEQIQAKTLHRNV